MADINALAENIAQLFSNEINVAQKLYDIFINPTPMDISFDVYTEAGEITQIVIPNRAKDMSVAKTGTGNPEGTVAANIGTAYVDTSNNNVYFKVSNSGQATGWSPVLTSSSVESAFRLYLTENKYLNEDNVETYLSREDYINRTKLNTALSTFVPTTLMNVLDGSGTVTLEDNSAYEITPTGTVTFVLPIIPSTDLGKLHKILVQVNMGDVYTIDPGATNFFDKIIPDLSEGNTMYNLLYEYDNINETWVVGCIAKGA